MEPNDIEILVYLDFLESFCVVMLRLEVQKAAGIFFLWQTQAKFLAPKNNSLTLRIAAISQRVLCTVVACDSSQRWPAKESQTTVFVPPCLVVQKYCSDVSGSRITLTL
jgi:hypothetical protein